MAHLRDWVDLGKTTIHSLRPGDVGRLYSLEWRQTQATLIADHQTAIAADRRRLRRWFRTASAILFGMASRLSPLRRVLFVLAEICFILAITGWAIQAQSVPVRVLAEVIAPFAVMTVLLAMELIDKIRMRDELVLARELQASLIPRSAPASDTWEIAAFNHIANTVGGDLYDFVELPGHRIAVLFGDASGHGMAAGLVMAVAHAAFRTQLEVDASPAAIMASLNRILCRTGGPRSFFSCCYVLLHPNGDFVATLAGHPPIVRVDASGRVVESIGVGAYPLGVKSGLQWEQTGGALRRGESLFLHSDGLTEARNTAGMEFGEESVAATIGRWHPIDSPHSMVDRMVSDWRAFTAATVVEDDMSITAIRRR